MNDFPELMPWDELTTTVKRLSQILDEQASALWQENEAMKIQVAFLAKQIDTLKNECLDLRIEVEGLRDFSYNSREQIDALEKVVADMLATTPLPEMEIVGVVDEIK